LLLSLALIGIAGGLITGISPCILPVLPVVFFSGGVQAARRSRGPKALENAAPPVASAALASGAAAAPVGAGVADAAGRVSAWRPYLVIAGLVVSFSVFTLIGSFLLAILGLPQDFLIWAGTIVLVIIGLGLIIPRLQHLIEKPFSWLPQRQVGTERGGFVLGIALGAVYVPCAGPVLAAITVAGATGEIGVQTIVLTLAFAIGAAIPLLVFALAGRRVAERVRAFRKHQRGIRIVGGVVMIALAIGLFFDVPQALQRLIPDYTSALQTQFSTSDDVAKQLNLGGIVTAANKNLSKCSDGSTVLQDCGKAPALSGIDSWFNTPGDKPLTLAGLKGKVVLVDFWAYSCINCQRSLPHTVGWYNAYKKAGLEVIGIHSPEYAFEKVKANVEGGARRFSVDYPVALDNSLSTWTSYRNRYWPAHYLIDATGTVRQIKFGEGGYGTTESLIRQLLVAANPNVQLPAQTDKVDTTPLVGTITPESYLSLGKVVNYGGTDNYASGTHSFSYPTTLAKNTFALSGTWKLGFEGITTPTSADLRLNYTASEVRMVLAGTGTVSYSVGGKMHTFAVSGIPTSYPLVKTTGIESGTANVTVSPGVTAYSFTFG
jgi:cytochrome c biogenesis protein CcdA/thiol-disulfide isomerase/thioredoxin